MCHTMGAKRGAKCGFKDEGMCSRCDKGLSKNDRLATVLVTHKTIRLCNAMQRLCKLCNARQQSSYVEMETEEAPKPVQGGCIGFRLFLGSSQLCRDLRMYGEYVGVS